MTGRMFLAEKNECQPKHVAVIFDFGGENFIYEDSRYFGRLTLDATAIQKLGPEPLSDDFQPAQFHSALRHSRQAIKIKLLDQKLVAGIGNIYASEALFHARLSPKLAASRLTLAQAKRLWRTIRGVLAEAIAGGSTVPLNYGAGKTGRSFFILAVRRARRIFTRNNCGFMIAPASRVPIAAGQSSAWCRPRGAHFIARIASAHEESV
jgi:formamidopyrimidine-DNA glycosylase